MLGLMLGQLRRQRVRTLTMLVGVLLATSGFMLLTGAVETSRLQVTGTVDEHYRTAYDILVRPAASRAAQESDRGLVRPNFLSGQFGGITMEQYEQVAALPGVEVAAPVGMVGYVQLDARAWLDLTGNVDGGVDRQLLRIRRSWLTDRGLSTLADPGDIYIYVTKNPVLWPHCVPFGDGGQCQSVVYSNGDVVYLDQGTEILVDTSECGDGALVPVEVLPDGGRTPVCRLPEEEYGQAGLTGARRTRLETVHLRPDGGFNLAGAGEPTTSDRLEVRVDWPMMLLLAAVDPVQEARLVGLDQAVASGRYLRADEAPAAPDASDPDVLQVPLLASVSSQVDEQLAASVERAQPPALGGASPDQLRAMLPQLAGQPLAEHRVAADEAYLQSFEDEASFFGMFHRTIQSGAPAYAESQGGALHPRPFDVDLEDMWRRDLSGGDAPLFAHDTALRPLTRLEEIVSPPHLDGVVVGTFDPTRLTEFSALSEVPLETYQPAGAVGADARTRTLLGEQPLAPNSNPGGYLATPPQLLTTFASLPAIVHPREQVRDEPVSAIRVRVAGVAGLDQTAQERVRLVAEQIATTTGLDVDITIGSSPAPQTVELPAGQYGRPELRLSEGWSAKGVAVTITEAVDRKSLLLFGLILVVCVLFLGNAVAASVRVRRRELAVLACLGWPGGRLAGLVLGEVALVGFVAGSLGAVSAFPLAATTGIDTSAGHAMLAVPLAVGLALAAGVVPAVRAGRAHPAGALHPPVVGTSRARRRRSVLGLAAANLVRVPARSLAAVLALAVGVAAVTTLVAVTWQFHGAAQGTLLGDVVSLQVRGVDVAAAVVTVLLGAFAVADVLYLSVRERDVELATLRACGWSDGELSRLVVYEGILLGVAGALTGGMLGLGVVAWFVGELTTSLLATALVVAGAGAVLVAGTALVPAQLVRRLPVATVLAGE